MFLNLPKAQQDRLKGAVDLSARAQKIKCSLETVDNGPALQAREIWASSDGDSVIIEDHVHRLAQITINAHSYNFFKQAWPVRSESAAPLSDKELSYLIVFLANIPRQSELLSALIEHIEAMAPQRRVG